MMDNTTFVRCYKTDQRNEAMTKAQFYREKKFNVVIVDGTDALVAMEDKQAPFLAPPFEDTDWIIVIASQKDFQPFN